MSTQTDEDSTVSWMRDQMTRGLGLEHTILEINRGVGIPRQRVELAIVRLMESDTVGERIRTRGRPPKTYYLSEILERAQQLRG